MVGYKGDIIIYKKAWGKVQQHLSSLTYHRKKKKRVKIIPSTFHNTIDKFSESSEMLAGKGQGQKEQHWLFVTFKPLGLLQ